MLLIFCWRQFYYCSHDPSTIADESLILGPLMTEDDLREMVWVRLFAVRSGNETIVGVGLDGYRRLQRDIQGRISEPAG